MLCTARIVHVSPRLPGRGSRRFRVSLQLLLPSAHNLDARVFSRSALLSRAGVCSACRADSSDRARLSITLNVLPLTLQLAPLVAERERGHPLAGSGQGFTFAFLIRAS